MILLVPMKTRGDLTIYRREPKPVDATRYVVGNNKTDRLLEDFTRYKAANTWMKQQQESKIP